jgi:hypothetical protein
VASKAMPRIPTACRAGDDQPHRLHPPCTEWSLRRTRGASCAGRSRTSAQNARREAPTVWRLCPER